MNNLYQYDLMMFVSSTKGQRKIFYRIDDDFKSVNPPYVYQQSRARRVSVYDQPLPSLFDSNIHQANKNSVPKSEGNFPMNQNSQSQQSKPTVRRQLLDNFFDVLAIAATCLIFGLIYALIKPFRRGFFCDDTSIQYPYKEDTVPMWMLGLYGGLAPILIFFIVEIWVVRPFHCGFGSDANTLRKRRIDYLRTIIQTIILFGLGAAVCFLITEVGKRTIGRLRPHYLTLCNPNWAAIQCTKTVQTLSGSVTISQYVIDHSCNSTASESQLQEARLSFPSGHASFSAYAFVFLFVYFEARLLCPNMKFLRPFLQCLCIAVAFFTALSRVTDYKHHATDVIGGSILGFSVAVFTAVRVGTYLWSFGVYCETEDQSEMESLPMEERVPAPGIDLRQERTLQNPNGSSSNLHYQGRSANGVHPSTLTSVTNRNLRIAPTTSQYQEDRL